MTLPKFPEVDLASHIQWGVNGIISLITTNLPVVIGAAIAITVIGSIVVHSKRMAKAAIH